MFADGCGTNYFQECFQSPYGVNFFAEYAEPVGGETTLALQQWARQHKVTIVGGSFPERDQNGKLYNTSLTVDPAGNILGKHRKVHLFDINVPGKISFQESAALTAGDKITVFDSPVGRLGIGICYDMRFSEFARKMTEAGAEILIYPGAFNMTTGPMHWELLQRGRAVDEEAFVITCAPARVTEGSGYVSFAHSMCVSPWGQILVNAGADEGVVFAEIDPQELSSIRESIPIWKQRQTDRLV